MPGRTCVAHRDRFLLNADFEDDQLTDLPPEHAQLTREMMCIDDDYLAAIPPDLELERGVQHGGKRLMMANDGK